MASPGQPDLRKSVVALFVDLVDSTALSERFDPERMHGVLQRYHSVCRAIVIEHGGVIEKFIGDAVMAVFGVPAGHEDDALRAVRAARSIVEAVPRMAADLRFFDVRLDVHCGIGAGEVAVISISDGDLRIVGDTVNTAARLQGAARPGEILVNQRAARLLRGRVGLEELDPLPLRGKAEPARTWRVTAAVPAQPLAQAPLIGRSAELRSLTDCYRQVVRERDCRQVAVCGEPGVGKTRLVHEFVAQTAREAIVLTGSCQPYGRDITFHPMQAMLRDSLPGGLPGAERMLGDGEAEAHARRTLTVLGDGDPGRGTAGVEEISWAVARLFATLAREQPLILIWEDVQWAEPMLLELIDTVVRELAGLPVLVVCVTRDEPSPERPPEATTIRLRPLATADTLRLVDVLSTGQPDVTAQQEQPVLTRIAERSGGNPLFVTALVDALAEDDAVLTELPPSISALLQARIDALPAAEKRALQWVATCGHDFEADQLHTLGTDDGVGSDVVARALSGLTRRGLVIRLPCGRLRCGQPLIRDTCYAMTAKSLRARWHALLSERERFPGEAMYHAEKAALLHRDVLPDDASLATLSDRAVRLLVDEGTAALHRRDTDASRSLFERALRLLAEPDARFADVTIRLSEALLSQGNGDEALRVLDDGYRRVDAAHRITMGLQRDIVGFRLGRTGSAPAEVSLGEYEAALSDQADDHLSWCLLHQFRGFLALSADRAGRAESAFRDALSRARLLNEPWMEDRLSGALCELVQWSPTTITDGLALCDELTRRFAVDRLLLIPVMITRARLLALAGDVTEARTTLSAAREHASDLHAVLPAVAIDQSEAVILALLGEHASAAARFTKTARTLRGHGHVHPAQTLEVYAVRETLRAGRYDAAVRAFGELDENISAIRARTWLRLLRARLTCLAGRPDEGFALVTRTVDTMITDDPCLRGDAWLEYADIARATGRPDDAERGLRKAEACYAAKGASLPVGRAYPRAIDEESGGS